MPRDADAVDAETRAGLGSVERAILDVLEAYGGLMTRRSVVHMLYPSLRLEGSDDRWKGAGHTHSAAQRTLVEATVSRAIASLARKGLITRDRQRASGRTLLRTTRVGALLPDWESVAREEEKFAAQAASRADHWRTLASRARLRALRLREERRLDATGDERAMDIHVAERLHRDSRAGAASEVINMRRVSLSRAVLHWVRCDRARVSGDDQQPT